MANVVINQVVANGSVYANGFYGTGLANAYAFRAESYVNNFGSANNRFVDVYNVKLATFSSAAATLYFYNYNSPDRIEVYQGNNLIASVDNAISLTSSDRFFTISPGTGEFFNDHTDLYMKDFTLTTMGDGKQYASYAGKITWTHNPTGGADYTIRTSKGDGSFDWRWILEYPVDGNTIGCPPLPPNAPTDVFHNQITVHDQVTVVDNVVIHDPVTVHVPAPPPPQPPAVVQTPSGDGGGCGCKIVCTAMNDAYGFGSFRQILWVNAGAGLTGAHEKGYHALFLPLVKWVYYTGDKNFLPRKLVKYLLENVVRHRTRDIWAQRKGKTHILGRMYRKVFEPICWVAGKIIGSK